MTRRTGPARVVAVNAKRPRTPPGIAIVGGADPMPADLRQLIRAALDEQRRRERG